MVVPFLLATKILQMSYHFQIEASEFYEVHLCFWMFVNRALFPYNCVDFTGGFVMH